MCIFCFWKYFYSSSITLFCTHKRNTSLHNAMNSFNTRFNAINQPTSARLLSLRLSVDWSRQQARNTAPHPPRFSSIPPPALHLQQSDIWKCRVYLLGFVLSLPIGGSRHCLSWARLSKLFYPSLVKKNLFLFLCVSQHAKNIFPLVSIASWWCPSFPRASNVPFSVRFTKFHINVEGAVSWLRVFSILFWLPSVLRQY